MAEYMRMCQSFDAIRSSYTRVVPWKQRSDDYPPEEPGRAYLLTHLQHAVTNAKHRDPIVTETRSGGHHTLIKKKNPNDYRISIPATIVQAIRALSGGAAAEEEALWCSTQATATWVVCYINGAHPDATKPGWERFDCSHRCVFNRMPGTQGRVCVEATCLVWESKADNQERGNKMCMRQCVHGCGAVNVCHCQGFHEPACL